MISRRPSLRRWFDPHSSFFSALMRGSRRRLQRRQVEFPMAAAIDQLEDRTLLSAGGTEQLLGIFGFETDTAVDPNNPNIVASSQFRTVVISYDGGNTFPTTVNVVPPLGYGAGGGDPTLSFDSQGRLYFGYLARNPAPAPNPSPDPAAPVRDLAVFAARIDINPVTQTAIVAQNATVALEAPLFDHDKEWVAADAWHDSPFVDNAYMVWTRFANTVNNPTTFSSDILFSRTTDNGVSWDPFISLNGGGQGFVWPSETAVARNGDVWVGWHTNTANTAGNLGEIRLRYSSDGGATFQPEIVAFPAGTADINDNAPPNPTMPDNISWQQGSVQPKILLDPVRPNNIYVISVDDPDNNYAVGDASDIVLARSVDYGVTWTRSTISHAPFGTSQLMPSAAIDEEGNIAVTWYDTRNGVPSVGIDQIPGNADDNVLLDLYATVSLDGGLTWSNDFQINEIAFDPDLGPPTDRFPPNNVFRIGEYNGQAADSGLTYVSWTANSGLNQDIAFDVYSMYSAFSDRFESGFSFESNNTLATATSLGSPIFVTEQRLTIDPGDTDDDEDFFHIRPHDTGKLNVAIYFTDVAGNLDLQILDQFSNVIASSTSTTDDEEITIPVVVGEDYFIRVFGVNGNTNHYDLEIENFPAPVPSGIHLDPASDTGMMSDDNYTADSTPRFIIQADLRDFADMGIDILTPTEVTANEAGAAVEVLITNSATGVTTQGFAEQIGSSNFLFDFTPAAPLTDGIYFVSASVVIFDGQRDANGMVGPGTPATGSSQLSEPLWITIDTGVPKGMVEEVFTADLTGAQEVGPVVTTAFGNATLLLNPAANRLEMTIELVGLDLDGMQTPDTSDDVTGLHIHNAAFGLNGGIVFGLIAPNNDLNGDLIIDAANSRVYSAWDLAEGLGPQLVNLRNGDLYINVHTVGNPTGEVRGQIGPGIGTVRMVQSSDTGMSVLDNVTNKMSPAFTGWAEANAKVRVFATNVDTGAKNLVGQGVVGSDGTDGVLNNGKGIWEVTVEPLADARYEITVEFEDLAGNISSAYSFAHPNLPAFILDDATNDYFLDVAHLFGSITDIDVKLDIEHPDVDQLDIFLIAPDGTPVELVTDVANDGANFTGTSFDDESAISINVGSAPYSGRFRPEGLLSALDGKDPNGQWTLRITDDELDDVGGLLLGWELCIKTDAGLPIWIDTEEPNTPHLDLVDASDTGMMIDDNITADDTPDVTVTVNDTVDGNGNPFPHDVKYRIYDRPGDGSGEVLLIDSYLTVPGFTTDGFFEHTLTSVLNDPNGPPLADGVHNLKLEVEDRAGNISHDFLLNLVIDTTVPKAMVEEVFRADLTGDQEFPVPVVTTAFGDAMLLLNPAQDRLEMTIELLGLDLDGLQTPFDPTDDVIALHIHNAPAGANGPIVFGLIDPNPAFMNDDNPNDLIVDAANGRIYSAWDAPEGIGTTLAAQLANLRNGLLYFNVHTLGNPGGEIRGQILAAGGAVRMVPSSDSGMSVIDNVTNKMSPAFTGWGEANSKVRVFAKNVETGSISLVGQGVVGTDGTDGVLGNGKGVWEVTVEPMVDGAYEITIEHEDLAGNISSHYDFAALGLPAAIPDDSFMNYFIEVEHLVGNITDVDLKVDIAHEDLSDLEFALTFDFTTIFPVLQGQLAGDAMTGTVFDSDASTNIAAGTAPYSGRFTTTVAGALSTFEGRDPNGTWRLQVRDRVAGNIGTLENFRLCIKTDAGLPIWIDTEAPNTPYLDLVEQSDTGRDNTDNITRDNTPTVRITADDTVDGDGNPFWHDIKYRIYDRPGEFAGAPPSGGEVLIVDSYASIPGFSELGLFDEILSRELNNPNGLPLHDGVHNLKLEVEDRAGNISHDFLLEVVVDTHKPSTFFGLPELAYDGLDHSSDSDVDVDPDTNSDRVTNDTTPTFFGTAEADSIIKVFVVDAAGNQVLIGQTVAVPIDGNLAYPGGRWEVTSALDLNDPSLGFARDGLRQIEVVGEDVAGNISYGQADVSFFSNFPANLLPPPNLIDFPDGNSFGVAIFLNGIAGRIIDVDVKLNVWHDNVDDVRVTLTHNDTLTSVELFSGVGGIGDNFIGTVLDDEAINSITIGAAPFTGPFIPENPLSAFDGLDADSAWILNFFDDTVNGIEGSFFAGEQAICVKLSPLEIFLDTQGPRVYDPDAGGPDQPIQVISDGVLDTEFNIFDIKPTTGPTPRVDGLKINIEDLPPRFVNSSPEFLATGAVTDASNATPIVITSVDHALQTGDLVEISGVTGNTAANGLFSVKKIDNDTFELVGSAGNGAYIAGGTWTTRAFPYRAIANNLALEGHIVITGDRVGNVAFKSITFVPDPDPPLHGESAKGCIVIEFYEPLEDDRFTLTIMDSVVDPANNAFDGESNAQEPFDNPLFPSGDGVAGGNFVARFTVDTRDEIAVFGQAGVFIDANGNYTFNPPINGGVNFDDVRDLVFDVGIQTDHIFAGEFKAPNQALVNGYDRIGAYGKIGGVFRFLLDIDDDGVVDLNFASNLQINALPIAGNFDGNAANGDEIGLFDGTSWFLDTTGNNVLDTTVTGNLAGLPIVGDFDGDGIEDLGTHDAGIDLFRLSLSSQGGGFTNALTTTTFIFGFPGVNERPAAGQLDADAADDIALTVPDQNGAVGQKEWYILITGDPEERGPAQFINNLIDPFSPTPVGDDYFTIFGDNQSVPIIGNFDPPTGKEEGGDSGSTETMAETAYDLDQSLGLVANSTYNWGGAKEKWLGSASGTWYFITENGKLYKWTGSKPGAGFVSGSQLVATFDANYYLDPTMLSDAQEPASGGGGDEGGTGEVDSLAQAAYDLDQSLGLEANATYNWGGAKEKWLGSASGAWYFITEDGKLYKWTGSSPGAGFVSGSQLVATLDPSYYADPSTLTEAPEPTAGGGGEEGGGEVDPLVQAAYDLDQSLGLVENATYNWGGAKEKWLGSASGAWYFITENGSLYKWTGSSPGAEFVSGSQLVATFDPSYYADPSKLFDAKLLDEVFTDPDGLLV
jgi:subtilisin-like proprotein convertase family protein